MKITNLQGGVDLHNGVFMPYFGLGVFLAEEGNQVEEAVTTALDAGYIHIDTASIYKNEVGVGRAVKNHDLSREELFITTKLWNTDQGYDQSLKAFESSLKKLDTDYIDLYLIHWAVEGKYKDSWRALEKLYHEGAVRAIGVSNFTETHLLDLMETSEIVPMVNQVEFHPMLQQNALQIFCKQHKIQYEAWSPLMRGKFTQLSEALTPIADKYIKTIPQIILRWNLQKGIVTIPKSVNRNRILENADIFDFYLTEEDMNVIANLDENHRLGPDPDNFSF
ncbi:MAG: aldo/keto reductase [Bacteroidales bacterium]